MEIISKLVRELDQEAETTRKMLKRVPAEKFDWQPHEKSMTLVRLATHVAELPSWITITLTTSELDFSNNPYSPKVVGNSDELLDYFEESLKSGHDHLNKANESQLLEQWTLRDGAAIFSSSSKYEFIRITFAQLIHHRAQLGVYLRLLDIPIPGSYGPSADEGFSS